MLTLCSILTLCCTNPFFVKKDVVRLLSGNIGFGLCPGKEQLLTETQNMSHYSWLAVLLQIISQGQVYRGTE